jgi:hypothetical protein
MLFNSKFKLLCYIKYLMVRLGLESDLAYNAAQILLTYLTSGSLKK